MFAIGELMKIINHKGVTMAIEMESPVNIGDEISHIHDASHFLYSCVKAVNGSEVILEIQDQIDLLISELDSGHLDEGLAIKGQLIEFFQSHINQNLDLETEENARNLIDRLDELARKSVELKVA